MPSLGDQVRDWQRGVQAVERGDWGCALRLFSGFPEPPAKMCFNVGCVHLLAGDPEAALRVSQGARAGGGDSTSAGGCSPTPTPGPDLPLRVHSSGPRPSSRGHLETSRQCSAPMST